MNENGEQVKFVARNEYKYQISQADCASLKMRLSTFLNRDNYSMGGAYCVKSLYFDNVYESDYLDKVAGEKVRKKVRIRIYDENDNAAKLEIKMKKENFQHKYSLPVIREEVELLKDGKFGFLLDRKEDIASVFYQVLTLEGYRPRAIIKYDRTAFLYPLHDTRITIDQNIMGCESSYDLFCKDLPYLYPDNSVTVLEVKFNGSLAPSIQKVLSQYHMTQVSYSKYCNGRRMFQEFI